MEGLFLSFSSIPPPLGGLWRGFVFSSILCIFAAIMALTYSKLRARYGALVSLGLPIVVGQIGNVVLGFADTLMVGHHSMKELAAASFVNTMFMLFVIFAIVRTVFSVEPFDAYVSAVFLGIKYFLLNLAVRLLQICTDDAMLFAVRLVEIVNCKCEETIVEIDDVPVAAPVVLQVDAVDLRSKRTFSYIVQNAPIAVAPAVDALLYITYDKA